MRGMSNLLSSMARNCFSRCSSDSALSLSECIALPTRSLTKAAASFVGAARPLATTIPSEAPRPSSNRGLLKRDIVTGAFAVAEADGASAVAWIEQADKGGRDGIDSLRLFLIRNKSGENRDAAGHRTRRPSLP